MTEIILFSEIQIILWPPVFGAAAGICSVLLYLKMPAGWLCDAGERPRTEHMPSMRRQLQRHGSAAGTGCAAAVCLYLIRCLQIPSCTTPASAAAAVLALIALSAAAQADAVYLIIPDQLTAFVLASGFFSELAFGRPSLLSATVYSLGGAASGFLVMLLCAALSLLLGGRQGIGAGDIKLTGACGALVGMENVPFLIFFASFGTACSALKDLLTGKNHPDAAKPAAPWIFSASAACLLLF